MKKNVNTQNKIGRRGTALGKQVKVFAFYKCSKKSVKYSIRNVYLGKKGVAILLWRVDFDL